MNLRLCALLGLPLSLVACDTAGERADTGECPAGEVCSPATPRGVHFIGASLVDDLFTNGPSPTAIGGTQEVSLEYDRGNGQLVPLNIPYSADDDGALGVAVLSQTGAVVTVKGMNSRTNYLRIVNPATGELYDRYKLTGAALEQIRLVGTDFESVPADRTGLVFAPGDRTIGVALLGEVQGSGGPASRRIVDTSMVLDLPGATRTSWDSIRIPNAQVGTYPLLVTAGQMPAASIPIEIVAGADAIGVVGQPVVPANSETLVCFQATNAGRYVYGLSWTFRVNGTTHVNDSAFARNCISVSAAGQSSGTVPVVATAGGQSVTVDVRVGPAMRLIPGAPGTPEAARSVPTEGDRAQM